MAKQITLELDEKLLAETEEIFENFGVDMQTGMKMFLTRVRKDKTLSFLFDRTEQSANESPDRKPSKTDGSTNIDDFKMTKWRARCLFSNRGQNVSSYVTFASSNQSTANYWANPNFELLSRNWSLILNDNRKHKLYLFNIPAHSISKPRLVARADIPTLIDLQIMYNDTTFTDIRSHYSFSKFYVDEIEY